MKTINTIFLLTILAILAIACHKKKEKVIATHINTTYDHIMQMAGSYTMQGTVDDHWQGVNMDTVYEVEEYWTITNRDSTSIWINGTRLYNVATYDTVNKIIEFGETGYYQTEKIQYYYADRKIDYHYFRNNHSVPIYFSKDLSSK